jgi:hypothetical protein
MELSERIVERAKKFVLAEYTAPSQRDFQIIQKAMLIGANLALTSQLVAVAEEREKHGEY